MEKHWAKMLRLNTEEVGVNREYEKLLEHSFGISKETCGSESLTMSFVRIKPGKRSRAHYHIYGDLAQYFIKGHGVYIIGYGTEDEQEFHFGPGCFIYIPRGVIHVIINTGDEDIESIAAYNCSSGDATGKFFCEMPLEEGK